MSGLPVRTAVELILPDGSVCWVKTLNELERKEAAEDADFWAAREVRPYRETGEYYQDVVDKFSDFEDPEGERSPEEMQASYLADSEWMEGDWEAKAQDKHAAPLRPERPAEVDDDKWLATVQKWEEDVAKAAKRREEMVKRLYEEAKARALALQPATRLKRCAKAFRERKYREKRGSRFMLEVIARAARDPEEHSRRVYSGADAVMALDDPVREALIRGYFEETDTVTPAEIPTSPVAS